MWVGRVWAGAMAGPWPLSSLARPYPPVGQSTGHSSLGREEWACAVWNGGAELGWGRHMGEKGISENPT